MKTLLKFAACILLTGVIAFASCSKDSPVNNFNYPPPPPPPLFEEYFFTGMGWDTTSDPVIMTMTLPEIRNNLLPADIISVAVKGNDAAYFNWTYPNPYYYKVINNLIVLYWRMDGFPFDSPADRVDVNVKLRL